MAGVVPLCARFDTVGPLARSIEDCAQMLAALEGGAEDVRASEAHWEIVTAPNDLDAVRAALMAAHIEIEQAEVTQLPTMSVPVTAENAPKVLRLVDAVEDLEDVQAVYANFDIPDDVLSEVG